MTPDKVKEYDPHLKEIVQSALLQAYEIHESLGKKGEERVEKNQFGETALRVDIESEKAVLRVLKKEGVPIRVVSEEHGDVIIGKNPLYLGILDGLDGSNRYEAGRGKERYGTMFGIFNNLDPVYDDYLVSGMMEHSTKRLFIASKGQGVVVKKGSSETPLKVISPLQSFNQDTRIYIDQHWELNRKTFSQKLHGYNIKDPRSFEVYFADLILGHVDVILACTRKNNLESTIGFGLVNEAGGIMVTLEGTNIRNKKYYEFGQNKQSPIIIASTKELANQIIKYLKKAKRTL